LQGGYAEFWRKLISKSHAQLQKRLEKIQIRGVRPVLGSDYLLTDLAVPVDDVGFGVLKRAVLPAKIRFRIAHGQKSELIALHKITVELFISVHANPQDDHALIGVLLRELVEGRNFLHTGLAPSGPEIEDEEFAAEVGPGHLPALIRFQGKLGRGFAGLDDPLLERPRDRVHQTRGKYRQQAE